MAGTNFAASAKDGGTWFSFRNSVLDDKGKAVFEDPTPGAGRVCLRDIQPFIRERSKARKMIHEWVPNTLTGSMERGSYLEDLTPDRLEQESGDLWDFAITGLENFFIGGAEVPCTREGKLLLMDIPAFDRFIGQCIKDLRGAEAQIQEAEEKNLSSGLNG
jgi:hypothetical protein